MKRPKSYFRRLVYALLLGVVTCVGAGLTSCSQQDPESVVGWTREIEDELEELAAYESLIFDLDYHDSESPVYDRLLASDDVLRSGTVQLAEPEAIRRLSRAEVVIVPDVHTNPTIATRASGLLRRVTSLGPTPRLPPTVFFELLPSDTERELQLAGVAVGRGDRLPLRRLLASNIPWPLSGYANFLETAFSLSATVRCMMPAKCQAVLPEDTPDDQRTIMNPSCAWVGSTRVPSTHQQILITNNRFLVATNIWRAGREGGESQLWMLIGCAHVLEVQGVATELRRAGVRVAVVVLQSDQLDLAAVRAGRGELVGSWLELAPDVFRAPSERSAKAWEDRLKLQRSLSRWDPKRTRPAAQRK
ncbi:MAG: hypothetical protein U1E39_11105 [Planctomycetota bacterium]